MQLAALSVPGEGRRLRQDTKACKRGTLAAAWRPPLHTCSSNSPSRQTPVACGHARTRCVARLRQALASHHAVCLASPPTLCTPPPVNTHRASGARLYVAQHLGVPLLQQLLHVTRFADLGLHILGGRAAVWHAPELLPRERRRRPLYSRPVLHLQRPPVASPPCCACQAALLSRLEVGHAIPLDVSQQRLASALAPSALLVQLLMLSSRHAGFQRKSGAGFGVVLAWCHSSADGAPLRAPAAFSDTRC